MVAGLLFIIGLISVLASIAMVGYSAPELIQMVQTALAAPGANILAITADATRSLSWSAAPIVGGLVLMGLARIIMLLGAINRSLRGTA